MSGEQSVKCFCLSGWYSMSKEKMSPGRQRALSDVSPPINSVRAHQSIFG